MYYHQYNPLCGSFLRFKSSSGYFEMLKISAQISQIFFFFFFTQNAPSRICIQLMFPSDDNQIHFTFSDYHCSLPQSYPGLLLLIFFQYDFFFEPQILSFLRYKYFLNLIQVLFYLQNIQFNRFYIGITTFSLYPPPNLTFASFFFFLFFLFFLFSPPITMTLPSTIKLQLRFNLYE